MVIVIESAQSRDIFTEENKDVKLGVGIQVGIIKGEG